MPAPSRRRPVANSRALLWIVLGCLAVVGLSIGMFVLLKSSGIPSISSDLPGPGRASLDVNNVEYTRAWVAEAVKRLKDAESGKNDAKTNSEIARVEKELKGSLLGKQVRWTFPVEAVDEGDVKLDSFFGTSAGEFRGDDPKLKGKPLRRVYLRVYFAADKDAVKVGDEVTSEEATRLQKGSKWTIIRTVTEVSLTIHDPWFSPSAYTDVVDALEPFSVTIELSRK
jgi:hypothetical protein